jgi:HSP20 family protein
MRFVFNDPYALRGAVEHLTSQQPIGTRRERDLPIPVDVYQQANEIVIEGTLPGAELKDLELTCEAGLLTLRGSVSPVDRDFAVQEIPRGAFSRTLALPAECNVEDAKASFENGIVLDAVKGQGYREVGVKSNRRKGRSK